MKSFRVTEEPTIVAPKASKSNGPSQVRIEQAESLEDLLVILEWANEDSEYHQPKDIADKFRNNNGLWTTEWYEDFDVEEPRSEDGYALDYIWISIEELSEKEVKKIEDAKLAKERAKNQKEKEKWDAIEEAAFDADCGSAEEVFSFLKSSYRAPNKKK